MEKETNIWDHFYGKYFFSLALNVRQSLIFKSPLCFPNIFTLLYHEKRKHIEVYFPYRASCVEVQFL